MLFFCGAQQRLKQLTQHNSGPDCSLCRTAVNRVAQAYRAGKHEVNYIRTLDRFCWYRGQRYTDLKNRTGSSNSLL